MSKIVGNVVRKVGREHPEYADHEVASCLAIICGVIIVAIGLIRCGWIVEFISLAAISAFMTGSAINIAVGQVPALMGITGFDARDTTYKVVINILKHLGRTKLDAAMGLTALFLLYFIRYACTYGARKMPNRSKLFFFIATLRTAFVILLYTMISWLVNRHHRGKKQRLFKILGTVPRGTCAFFFLLFFLFSFFLVFPAFLLFLLFFFAFGPGSAVWLIKTPQGFKMRRCRRSTRTSSPPSPANCPRR